MEAGAPPKMTDTDFLFTIEFRVNELGELVMDKFHAYDEFKKLSIDLQNELINEAMEELGEEPAYAGVGKQVISLN